MTDPLARIAAALDRALPPPPPAPRRDAPAYAWVAGGLAETALAALPIGLLTGIDAQVAALRVNTERLAAGHAAHDALLWGVRGAGKSAAVKSVVAAVQSARPELALAQLPAAEATALPALFTALAALARPVVVFVDDLGFGDDDAGARMLRSVLDGGACARSPGVRLYVTANRRHIVGRDAREQDDPLNARDVVEDRLALADRFGISLGFHAADQAQYLAMCAGYARALGIAFDDADALSFATQRGARSGRVAHHYAVELAGRAGRSIDALLG